MQFHWQYADNQEIENYNLIIVYDKKSVKREFQHFLHQYFYYGIRYYDTVYESIVQVLFFL